MGAAGQAPPAAWGRREPDQPPAVAAQRTLPLLPTPSLPPSPLWAPAYSHARDPRVGMKVGSGRKG